MKNWRYFLTMHALKNVAITCAYEQPKPCFSNCEYGIGGLLGKRGLNKMTPEEILKQEYPEEFDRLCRNRVFDVFL